MVEVNLKGVINGTKAVLPSMLKQGHGHILNMASGAATNKPENHSVYSATKMGVVALTKSVDKEIEEDIRINAIHPGTTKTVLSGFHGGPREEVAERIIEVYKLDKSGEELDVGNRDFVAESKTESERE